MRIRLLGVGMGPQHVTAEVAHALRSCDYVVAARKAHDDELFAIRQAICDEHGVELVAVADPARDRQPADYPATVSAWHDARAAAYAEVIGARRGTAAFLVWGDPSLYDSTIRIVEQVAARGRVQFDYSVIPGISSVQALAASHRIALNAIGGAVHIVTARGLGACIGSEAGSTLVMLDGDPRFASLDPDLTIFWGAYLGSPDEITLTGRLGDVAEEILRLRREARARHGWIMDTYLLRKLGE